MRKTRDKILSVYEEKSVGGGRGLFEISLEELAQGAGINKRTIYRYFGSKEEIIAEMLDIIMEKTALRITKILSEENDLRTMLIEVIKTIKYLANGRVLEDLRRHYPLLWQKIELFRRQKIQQFFDSLINNQKMRIRWRVNPMIAHDVFIAALAAVLNPQYIFDHSLTFEETGNALLEMFMFGAMEQTNE
ncbi:regulatory protein TetR [Syntrophobotulus glycolicus DSM 8271]|uniref:Regulatory protein TetR n=1 Tax=Syntrophobotulus glycolicus (strain DSM 8271 / FlGlyR) TaxID=645991 RepID=F0SVP1_SYNGF|nr:TetR/AcrR family transcriptional regulator [Syntrophobotulus glycolicus]ADY54517.1 regulatory protein TetR [Syntrophobotulus glycolicus DSM 8271]